MARRRKNPAARAVGVSTDIVFTDKTKLLNGKGEYGGCSFERIGNIG
ncbi:MAG: hypothetical protein U9Q92_03215 [archaeon]|nr:hypothetical protein [archaeon]